MNCDCLLSVLMIKVGIQTRSAKGLERRIVCELLVTMVAAHHSFLVKGRRRNDIRQLCMDHAHAWFHPVT